MSRDVYGAPWDGLGCEPARLAAGPEDARVDGLVLLRRDGVAIDYPETFRRIWPA